MSKWKLINVPLISHDSFLKSVDSTILFRGRESCGLKASDVEALSKHQLQNEDWHGAHLIWLAPTCDSGWTYSTHSPLVYLVIYRAFHHFILMLRAQQRMLEANRLSWEVWHWNWQSFAYTKIVDSTRAGSCCNTVAATEKQHAPASQVPIPQGMQWQCFISTRNVCRESSVLPYVIVCTLNQQVIIAHVEISNGKSTTESHLED